MFFHVCTCSMFFFQLQYLTIKQLMIKIGRAFKKKKELHKVLAPNLFDARCEWVINILGYIAQLKEFEHRYLQRFFNYKYAYTFCKPLTINALRPNYLFRNCQQHILTYS